MICPNCNASMPDEARFCGACGQSLSDVPDEPLSASSPEPSNEAPAEPESKDQEPAGTQAEPTVLSRFGSWLEDSVKKLGTCLIVALCLGVGHYYWDSSREAKAVVNRTLDALVKGDYIAFCQNTSGNMRPPNDLEFHKGSIYFVMAGADGISVRAGSVHRTERHDRLQVEIMAEAPTGEKDVMGFMIVQKIGGKWKVVDLISP